jgi:dTDP-4-dehydrorhamnose 3,5-epimerase
MKISSTQIPDVKIISPRYFYDHRGYFVETHNRNTFLDHGIDVEFVQDNHSYSAKKGTLRGLHFQIQPFAQWKLITVLTGSIFDVAVDIRTGSPSHGKFTKTVLDSENKFQMLVPAGFAHGFVTLEDDTLVSYKVSAHYSPDHEKGIHWADPDIAIDWPDTGVEKILSDKDIQLPKFSDLPEYFVFPDGGAVG